MCDKVINMNKIFKSIYNLYIKEENELKTVKWNVIWATISGISVIAATIVVSPLWLAWIIKIIAGCSGIKFYDVHKNS